MDYRVGKMGRMFVLRLGDNDDVYESVHRLARQENLRSAMLIAVGGIRRAKVVVGPKSPIGRPEPMYREFDDAREAVGVGTLFWDDEDKPLMHLHMGFGRGDTVVVGCPRGGAETFCILEMVIIEIEGIDAIRASDLKTGFKLLSFLR
jgi:predicted DNA-binding protein with PD1-like motif